MANARNNSLEMRIPSPTMNFKQRIQFYFEKKYLALRIGNIYLVGKYFTLQ